MKHIKKYVIVYIFLILLLYLIIGAIAPFIRYQQVSETTKQAFHKEDFIGNRTGSDRAMILETNQSAWDERVRLLNLATEQIILSTYDMREGESTADILSILLQKAEQGVHVQILVDGISGLLRMEGRELFYAVASHPQVEIKLYNRINLLQPWKTQGRMHDKYIIVDDLGYLLGGRNTFDYFLGEYDTANRSLDREILVYNTQHGTKESKQSSLNELRAYFDTVWDSPYCSYFHEEKDLDQKPKIQEERARLIARSKNIADKRPDLYETYEYSKVTCPTTKIRLISNPITVYAKEPTVFYQAVQLMRQASDSVRIHTPYAVTNTDMNQMLREVRESVPDMKLVLNSVENGDNFMASSDYLWNKKNLIQTGMTIYEYDGGTSAHGKSILIDDSLSLIGSYNMDLRSTYVDTELMLVVDSKELNAELRAHMDALEKDCRQVITEHEYMTPEHIVVRKQPFWKKTALRAVGLLMQGFRYLI
ncbi:MAG: phospholipase D family protein [Lachnospiraceae bacterium]